MQILKAGSSSRCGRCLHKQSVDIEAEASQPMFADAMSA